ncbi:MAG TPA: PHB depolymerase family esterase [Polyangiaceae bacterium]|nr:PHB depolymerase family esterase [Polyangiaceae bacterium]
MSKLRRVTAHGALLLAFSACDRTTAPSAATRPATAVATASVVAPTLAKPGAPSEPPTNNAAPTSAAPPASSTPSAATAPIALPASQIYQPSGLAPGERRPLLIFLHGLGASGKAAFDVLHLAAFGARERVFVLAPDGTLDRQKRQFWNAGTACCNFDRRDIDDVARLTQLIDTWRARPDVDSSRIYVMGHSNGGFMTERLVCALGDRITAAASMAGAAPPSAQTCTPTKQLALLEVHGDADDIVRYTGGSVFDSPELAPFPSIEQGFRDWAKRFGCAGPAQASPDRDLDARLPGSETRVLRYSSCTFGSVELWTVRGGNHFIGTGQQAFEAIWQFLSAHHS